MTSPTMLKLRPYQREAVDAAWRALADGMMLPAIVLPTGAGKTVVFSHLASEYLALPSSRGKRVLILAHREELIQQATAKMRSVAPGLRVGVVKAGMNQTLADVVVGCVATLRNERRRKQLLDVGLVIVDECHHATSPSYQAVLTHFGCFSGGAPAVGFTATMVRGDGAALGQVWQEVVYTRSIAEMIRDGYLVRPRGIRVKVDDLDLKKVRKSRGDYSESDLGRALTASMAPSAVAKAYVEHAAQRPGLLFAPTVASATVMSEALAGVGITSALVHGEMGDIERQRALDDFREGKVQTLANCMVLTEGTDLPHASCAVIARPTTHKGLYIQMAGRVLRPHPTKLDALLLDVVGASQKHALESPVELFGEDVALKSERDEEDEELDESQEDEIEAGQGLGMGEEVYADGPLVSEEVDLFHGSTSAWLRTYGGTWFLPAGDRYIAIIPAPVPGEYDVVAMHGRRVGESRWVARGVSELGYAMAWAEGDVTPVEASLARKERSWRARKPSQAQVELATRLGMAPGGALSGEVSNYIAVTFASRRIDPRMPAYARR